jgi:hypothetical protein
LNFKLAYGPATDSQSNPSYDRPTGAYEPSFPILLNVHITPDFDGINDTIVFVGTVFGELPTPGQEYALFCKDLVSVLEATRNGCCDKEIRKTKRVFIILSLEI